MAGPGFQFSLFDERDFGEVHSPEFPDERLIACRNPLLQEERARKREELLQATETGVEVIVQATQRPKNPLQGKERDRSTSRQSPQSVSRSESIS